ncbi:MAG: hypothetical protein U0168_28985 [Nannocystaceae bacterium]
MRPSPLAIVACSLAVVACHRQGGDAGDGGSSSSSSGSDGGSVSASTNPGSTAGSASSASGTATTQGTTAGSDSTDAGNPTSSADPDSSSGDPVGDPGGALFEEDFEGLADGAPWPAPWTVVGGNVLGATVESGRGALAGITGATGRIALPGFDARDVEVLVTFEIGDWNAQGFGFYVRQNGGALTQTDPPGQGYAVFIEGFYMQAIGVWREIDGVEELLAAAPDPIAGGFVDGARYTIRYRVEQTARGTQLRARVWPQGEPEPTRWAVDQLDATPQLQDVGGSFAVDVYNAAGTGSVFADDIVVTAL